MTDNKRRYIKTHEWLMEGEKEVVQVGITDYAQNALGDVVFIELPQVGDRVEAGGSCCVVESVKVASDVYSPIAGEIVAVNDALEADPGLVNQSPFEAGWLFEVKADASVEGVGLDEEAYQAFLAESEH